MLYGVGLPEMVLGDALSELFDVVSLAEDRGFHSAWAMDNPLRGVECLDPLVALAAASALSQRIGLGTAVIISALRAPVQLASELAAIDQLSQGRLVVGVGLGADRSLYEAFGISADNRAKRFSSGVELMKRLWLGDRVDYRDEFWSLTAAMSTPKPFRPTGPPIWFGGSDLKALKRAVALGDGWIGAGSSSLDDFARRSASILASLSEAGRPRSGFTIAKRMYVCLGAGEDSRIRTRAWFRDFYGDESAADRFALVGAENECLETLRYLEELGTDLVILNTMFDHVRQLHRLADLLELEQQAGTRKGIP